MGRTRWVLSRSTGNAAAVFCFSNPALHFRQECSFFKSNTAFAAAVLPFQIQHCFCRSSIGFLNSTLHLRRQCSFLKSNTVFAPAVLLFQLQRCKRGKNIDSLRIRDSTQMAFSLRVSIPAVEE